MIRYLSPKEIDRPQWDALIHEAPNGLIYALSWYLDIVSPGWAAFVKEELGRYVAVLPLPERRKFGLRYLKQPLFTQQLGLFYVVEPSRADWAQITDLLKKEYRFIARYAFNTANMEAPESLELLAKDLTSECTIFHTFHLCLRPEYGELLAGYTTKRRWSLTRARRHGWLVEPTTDIEALIALFKENTASKIYGGVSAEAYDLLRSLYTAASQAGLVALWQARTANGPSSAIIMLLQFKNQLTYLFSAAIAAGKKDGATTVLLDEVIRAHAGQAVRLDFEAPPVASVAHYYRRFNAQSTSFLTITADRLPWPVRQLRAARMALYRRLRPRPAPDQAQAGG